MKLDILQENLNHALALANRVLVSKPQIPILSNILLVAKNGKLTLTASNLETSLIVETGTKITTEGQFTVPGHTFFEIISSLSAEKILLEEQKGSLIIKSGSFHGRVNGLGASEYPKLSSDTILNQDNYWEIDKEEFQQALVKVIFSAATDDGRAALTGILFKPKEKGLTLAATDGFRLSVVDLAKANPGKKQTPAPIIIPARSLTELFHILDQKETETKDKTVKIFISETENQIFFDLGDIKIFSRLIAGNFPDYEKIIPSDSSFRIVTTTEELSKTVRLASIFARESANIVKFKISGSKLYISANAAQVGENESTIDVSVAGENRAEEFAIAFNYRYLLDLLGVINGEVTMEFSGPIAPGVFHSSSSPNFLHIIMPVRVQG